MPSLTIKSIPEDLLAKLRHSATAHRRSLNSEVLVCLEHSLSPKQIDPEGFLTRIEYLQERTNLPRLTDAMLDQAKRQGRP